jgi:glycosyltransferase involved in cell wall biosynthesis
VSDTSVDLTVIVPVVERPSSLTVVYEETAEPLRRAGFSAEFIFVSYPWHRHLTDELAPLRAAAASAGAAGGAPIRVLEVGQALGETALLKAGAAEARGRMIATVPAYPQADPSGLPALLAEVRAGADLVVGYRFPRRDSLVNRAQNRILHAVVGRLGGGRLHDVACGLRAMRRDLLSQLPLYGDFARFLPLLAMREGYRVEEVPVAVHSRAMRGRIYSPGVYLRRLFDVLGLVFLFKFTDKPLRFFGLIGSALAGFGALLLLVALVQKLGGQPLANRPLLLLGVLLMTLGAQAIALGLIGEIIVHLSAAGRRRYRLQRGSAPTRSHTPAA